MRKKQITYDALIGFTVHLPTLSNLPFPWRIPADMVQDEDVLKEDKLQKMRDNTD